MSFPGITCTSSIPTGPARVASEPADADHEKRPDSSKHFTPAQQAVAAALMVVMKRAMNEGREAAMTAKQALISNNPATQPFLMMLPDDGPLPTMQHVKQESSDELCDGLINLAKQCAAAHCQPLEVFTRSVQCTTHKTAMKSLASKGRMYHRQQQLHQLDNILAQYKRQLSNVESISECLYGVIIEQGVPESIAILTASFLQTYRLLRDTKYWYQPATEHRADLDHLLPGALDALVENADADFLQADGLGRLVPSITAALLAYKTRAAQCGQTFEHMVRLEAAVQGWPLATHAICCDLLTGIIETEPAVASIEASLFRYASNKTSSAAAEVPPEGRQVHKHPAMDHIYKCPADVATIFTAMLGVMDLSPIPELSPIPPRTLNKQEERLKDQLTEGLFPGTMEELYCALNSSNTEMCPALVRAAARHVESYVTIWIRGTRGKESVTDMLGKEQDVFLKELPLQVGGALDDIIARVKVCNDTVKMHLLMTGVLYEMQNQRKAGQGATIGFWLLKALAQAMDIHTIYPEDSAPIKAAGVLLDGTLQEYVERVTKQKQLGLDSDMTKEHEAATRSLQIAVYMHVQAARSLGKPFNAYLHETAPLRGSGEGDVAHLIDILADHVAPNLDETPAWQDVPGNVQETAEVQDVITLAFLIADAMGRAAYVALCRVFPGFPDIVLIESYGNLGLPKAYKLTKQQIQVYKHIASVRKLPLSLYIEDFLERHGVDTRQEATERFCGGVYKAAAGIKIDAAQAKRAHISMCVKAVLHGSPVTVGAHLLELLDKLTSISAENAGSLPIVKALGQALPGVWMSLFRLHRWPHGLGKSLKWLTQAAQLVGDIMAKHARSAHEQGIPYEEYMRKVSAVPGLQNEKAELLVSMFRDFWAAQKAEAAFGGGLAAENSSEASSVSPGRTPAESSTGAEALPSGSVANGPTAENSNKAAETGRLSQQNMNSAADVVGGAPGEEPSSEASHGTPAQQQEAARPESGFSTDVLLKTERKKAKKARQRAARAAATAQTAEGDSKESKELGPTEDISNALQQERSAEAQAAAQLHEAGHVFNDAESVAPESLPAPSTPAQSSEAAISSRSSSISPQPSWQLQAGMSHGELDPDLPGPAAPAAQAADRAAQEEEPWQEVKTFRRKPASQQAASKASMSNAPNQGRDVAHWQSPAGPHSCPGDLQAAALQGEQLSMTFDKSIAAPGAESQPTAAKQIPGVVSASPMLAAGSNPQLSARQSSHKYVPPFRQACDNPIRMQSQPFQVSNKAKPDQAVPQQAQHPGVHCAQAAKEDYQDNDNLCVVCWEELREVIFYHCMHMCTCQGCAKDIMAAGGLCPMCRSKIQSTIIARF
ncbi:g5540 [Coccomyxa viridis]|uniref:G5540 protein n=1 Tax=Coccomyxa viridis TaxID=1274662 RepID=A0ABP1FT42_9CHLO